MTKERFLSHLFDSVLFVYFQDLCKNLIMFWVIFGNIGNSKGFTNFQAALYMNWINIFIITLLLLDLLKQHEV